MFSFGWGELGQVYLTADCLVLPSLLSWNSRPFCSPGKVRLQPSFQGQLLRLGFAGRAQGAGKGRRQEGPEQRAGLRSVCRLRGTPGGHLGRLTCLALPLWVAWTPADATPPSPHLFPRVVSAVGLKAGVCCLVLLVK